MRRIERSPLLAYLLVVIINVVLGCRLHVVVSRTAVMVAVRGHQKLHGVVSRTALMVAVRGHQKLHGVVSRTAVMVAVRRTI